MNDDGLTIREVSRRTGVESATLRMWEQRHGFPVPERRPSGHRRYSHLDVEFIRQVVRDRASGLELKAAIENVKRAERGERAIIDDDSIYAGVRRRRADLRPYLLSKRTLISVSQAIEDECLVTSRPAMLIGSFQRARYYRSSEARWRDLAQSCECAFVLADFDEVGTSGDGPVEVPVDSDEPIRREWALIYDAPGFGAVLTAWERPGQDDTADSQRCFEALWSVEPELVRDAATVAYGIIERSAPDVVEGLEEMLKRPLEAQQPTVSQLTGLTNRIVAYVSANGASDGTAEA